MKASTIFAILVGIVFAIWLIVGSNYPVRAMVLPFIMLIPALLLSVVQIVRECRGEKSAAVSLGITRGDRKNYVVGVAFIVVSIVLTVLLGFMVAIPLCTLAMLKLRGEKWWVAIVISGILAVFAYGMFILVIRMPPPGGILLSYD